MTKSKIFVCICTAILFSFSISAQKAGDKSHDVKAIDADIMLPFNNGAAVIFKGKASALIDTNGNFIVPYGKYRFNKYGFEINRADRNAQLGYGIGAGLFMTDTGVVNSKGVLFASAPKDTFSLSPDGNYIQERIKGAYFLIDTTGAKTAAMKDPLVNIAEGIAIVSVKGGYNYFDLRTNKKLNSSPYENAEPFSNGMACVRKKDQFDSLKYGFIDSRGTEVIPCNYTSKPSRFSEGYSIIEPKPGKTDQFKYAFINKMNNIVYPVTEDAVKMYGNFSPFTGDYSFSEGYVTDNTFKPVALTQFLNAYKINNTYKLFDFEKVGFCNDGKIRYQTVKDNDILVGFIDKASGDVVDCIFKSRTSSPIYFDKAAGLSYAETIIGKDSKNNPIYRKGYINEKGVYMIIKDEDSIY